MEIWTKRGRKGKLIFAFKKYQNADWSLYMDSVPCKTTGPKIKYAIYISYVIKITIVLHGRQRTKDLADVIIEKKLASDESLIGVVISEQDENGYVTVQPFNSEEIAQMKNKTLLDRLPTE